MTENFDIYGDDGDNMLSGTPLGERIAGLGGNDLLLGQGGGDTLDGGAGDDTLWGGSGPDVLYGGAGSDVYYIDDADDRIVEYANGGSDTAVVLVTFTLPANVENLQLLPDYTISGNGNALNNVIYGNNYNNALSGFYGADSIYGGGGNDLIFGGTGGDYLDGGAGDDTINPGSAGDARDTIVGSAGNDTIIFTDITAGNCGNVITYSGTWDGLSAIINGAANTGLITTALGTTTLVDVANVLIKAQSLYLFGSEADDIFTINGGAESWVQVWGRLGNDTFNLTTSGEIELYYDGGTGIIMNLETGVVADDGFGYVDRINLVAGAARLFVSATDASDWIKGSASAEAFHLGGGSDTLDGGGGTDALYFNRDEMTSGVSVDLGAGTATGSWRGATFNHRISNIEEIWGSAFADTLTGDGGANTLSGGDGADVLSGLGGNDALFGGSGDDVLYGSSGDDSLYGGAGDDVLNGGTGADVIDGGDGTDQASYKFSSSGVAINLALGTAAGGAAAGDKLFSIEDLKGSQFNDTLTGDSGANRIYALDGNDALSGGDGDDWLYGDDTLLGGAGDDRLYGGAGADVLDGGAGTDQASYEQSTSGVTVDLATGRGSRGEAAGDTLRGIENIAGSEFGDIFTGDAGNNRFYGNGGNDTMFGGGGVDRIKGGTGDDQISGGDGDDWFDGGPGADRFDGGSGQDMVSYEGSTTGVFVDFATKTATGGDAAGDSFTSIENLGGSHFADTLIGDAFDNRIYGFGGNDLLYGGGGADRILAGDGDDLVKGDAGNDWLMGGLGADTLDGGSGTDMAVYEKSASGVTVNLALNTASGGDAAGDSFISIENLAGSNWADMLTGDDAANRLLGGGGNDTLIGGGGDDKLIGGAGDDVLIGGAGDDYMVGDAGADRFDGGEGEDQVSYHNSTSRVTVNLATGTGGGDAAGDRFVSVENVYGTAYGDTLIGDEAGNRLWGNGGNDYLFGAGGFDRIYGGNGDDTIDGGLGDDWFVGGSGADVFKFTAGWGKDTVSDFEDGKDILLLSGTGLAFANLTIAQVGSNTLITATDGNSILLSNTLAANIDAFDFYFS